MPTRSANWQEEKTLKIKVLDKEFEQHYLDAYAHAGDAGIDMLADHTEKVCGCGLATGAVTFGTSLCVAIPSGCVGLVFARSGLGTKHGIVPRNCVGVIDSGYRGEIKVTLQNLSSISYSVHRGDRIAQLVVMPCVHCKMQLVDELDDTERGSDGYGSTGR